MNLFLSIYRGTDFIEEYKARMAVDGLNASINRRGLYEQLDALNSHTYNSIVRRRYSSSAWNLYVGFSTHVIRRVGFYTQHPFSSHFDSDDLPF